MHQMPHQVLCIQCLIQHGQNPIVIALFTKEEIKLREPVTWLDCVTRSVVSNSFAIAL